MTLPTAAILNIPDLGGYGDLLCSLEIAKRFRSKGIPFYINLEKINVQKMIEAGDSDYYISYCLSKPGLREKLLNVDASFEKDIFHKGQEDGKKFISITYSHNFLDAGSEIARNSKAVIAVTEYDCEFQAEKSTPDMIARTGFSHFVPEISKTPQIPAGLLFSESMNEKLNALQNKTANPGRIERRLKLLESLDRIKKMLSPGEIEKILAADWSVFYPSSIKTRGMYIEALSSAMPRLKRPLAVFSFGEGKKLEKLCAENSVPFKSAGGEGKKEKFCNSKQAMILNLDSVPADAFEDFIMESNALSVVTGNHSLTQMLQKNQNKGIAAPFLYHPARWLGDTFAAMKRSLGQSEFQAGWVFSNYFNAEGLHEFIESDYEKTWTHKDLELLARLFYNNEAAEDFKLSQSFILPRLESEARKATGGCFTPSAVDAVEFLATALMDGKTAEMAARGLLLN